MAYSLFYSDAIFVGLQVCLEYWFVNVIVLRLSRITSKSKFIWAYMYAINYVTVYQNLTDAASIDLSRSSIIWIKYYAVSISGQLYLFIKK